MNNLLRDHNQSFAYRYGKFREKLAAVLSVNIQRGANCYFACTGSCSIHEEITPASEPIRPSETTTSQIATKRPAAVTG